MSRIGRLLLAAAIALFAWGAIVAVSGGVRFDVGPVRVSSRDPARPVLLAVLALVLAWRIANRAQVRWLPVLKRYAGMLDDVLRRPPRERAAAVFACTAAVALLGCGVAFGSRTAGGADAFGYVSASVLWANGLIGLDGRGAASLLWPSSVGAFVPLAYRLGRDNIIGPTVAPGLPLLMAAGRPIWECWPYLVPALCGSALVLLTFELGRRLFNVGVALAAALLVACSPVILFQSLVVMADVPAAAFWTGALVAALASGTRRALFCGALSGVAILIRPNLAPLAVFPWLLTIARADRGAALARTAAYAAGSIPAALFVAWLNHRLYGSVFSSGYGDVGAAFALRHVGANFMLHTRWWFESQGPLAFLFVIPLCRRRSARQREVAVIAAYAVCVWLLYAFYLPFDQWWYLRFLIPALPIVFLLCAEAVDWLAWRSPSLRAVGLVLFAAFAAAHAARFIAAKDVLSNNVAERRRYLDAARFLDTAIPAGAVVLAMQHSGSVRYYAGRLTMRWDVIDPAAIDAAVAALRTRGVPLYALLEDWEEQDFRRRFAGQRAAAALTTPIARSADDVRLYALDPAPGAQTTALMPAVDERCVDASPRFVYSDAERRLAEAPAGTRRPFSER